jgi:hypothetical protein
VHGHRAKTTLDKKQPKREGKYVGAVLLWKIFLKDAMRSYASQDGSFLLTEGKPAAKYFTVKTVRTKLSEQTSELVKRPGMGANLLAANIEAGLQVLACVPLAEQLTADMAEKQKKLFAKLGFTALSEFLPKDLAEWVHVLSVANEQCMDTEKNERVAKKLFAFLGKDDGLDSRMKTCAKIADASARLYGMAMSMMEGMALASNVKEWAKKVPQLDKQDAAVRHWVKKPTVDNLAKAVAAYLHDRVTKAKRKATGFCADSEPGDESQGSGSGDSSVADPSDTAASEGESSSGQPGKKDSKGKRGKSPSGSSSDGSEKPRKKKGKKDSKQKRKDLKKADSFVKIRRVTKVTADGKAAWSPDDPCDEVKKAHCNRTQPWKTRAGAAGILV